MEEEKQPDISEQTAGELLERAELINRVLYAIANAVNTTPDLDELYQAIHNSLGNIIDVTNFFIAIVDSKEKTIHFPYCVDSVDEDYPSITNFDVDNSLTGLVILRRQPIFLRQEALKKRATKKGIQGSVPLIWIGVPLIIRNEVIGILAVQSYTDPFLFSENDLQLLTAISDQTAIAIDRKRSTDNLQKSEKRFRQLFEQSNDAIIVHNRQGKILDCNHRACEILKYKKSSLLQMTIKDLQFKKNLATTTKALQETDRLGYIHFETKFKKSDGSCLDVEISARIIDRQNEGTIQGIVRDITERKQAEERLLRSEKKYRNLFHNAQVGLFSSNLAQKPKVECNNALAKMLGYENREDFLSHFSPEKAHIDSDKREELINRVRSEGRITDLEVSVRKKSGDTGWFRFSADYYSEHNLVEGVVIDITETKIATEEKLELQRQLEQSRKMEALGLLASGVAHDLNNILAGIISYPELIMLDFPDNGALKKPLEAIQESGKRAAEIVGDLLTLARGAASVREIHNLHTIIQDYLKSPECGQFKLLYPDISIQTDLSAPSPTISCSPVHVKKCLMNLVTNSFEAIDGSGSITLSTTNLITTLKPKNIQQEEVEAEYVVLSVEDSGPGISDSDREHIFEPFYTRKKMGRSGTGLGLTVVWNTMRDHKGKVDISNNETGSCFKLFFPVDGGLQPPLSPKIQPQKSVGNGESILIVDDESQLRDIACRILTTVGYSTYAVNSGEMALEHLKKNEVDLVLLDMQMEPGMNGYQTYKEIIQNHPGQKAVIASGFAESDDVKAALRLGVGSYIKKPYTVDQLSRVVSRELKKNVQ